MTRPNDDAEIQVTCRVPTAELCYVRYTLEAYEGLCLATTLPGGEGRVRLATSAAQRRPLEALLDAMAAELPLVVEGWAAPGGEDGSGDP